MAINLKDQVADARDLRDKLKRTVAVVEGQLRDTEALLKKSRSH